MWAWLIVGSEKAEEKLDDVSETGLEARAHLVI